MPGPFDTPPRRWDPTTEIHPGGPHPGMVHQMMLLREEEERRRRGEDDRSRLRRRRLLLQR